MGIVEWGAFKWAMQRGSCMAVAASSSDGVVIAGGGEQG